MFATLSVDEDMPESDAGREFRKNFKNALCGPYSLKSLRDVVYAFIREPQETYVPFKEAETCRERNAAANLSAGNQGTHRPQPPRGGRSLRTRRRNAA